MPTSAQKPLTKPEKSIQTQNTPDTKLNTTMWKSDNMTSTNSNNGRTTKSNDKTTSVSEPTGYVNVHGYVDLGLSVKWATCNVGASSPSDYGSYYAWGETRTKSEYSEENSVTRSKMMSSIAGNPIYDVARANWGGTWRLPTKEEIDELVSKCEYEWTTQGGHKGYKITGPNGNSIFLPAAGWHRGTTLGVVGEYGSYWSATPYEVTAYSAYYLYFNSGHFYIGWNYRSYGQSVRPVIE